MFWKNINRTKFKIEIYINADIYLYLANIHKYIKQMLHFCHMYEIFISFKIVLLILIIHNLQNINT